MSFVFAEITDYAGVESLKVLCDTKIDVSKSLNSYSQETRVLVDKYGMVKTTILCPEISISFAGNNIYLASKLFGEMAKKVFFSTMDVIDCAKRIHLNANADEIEFIVMSCEDGCMSLWCIKNRRVYSNVQSCWIGSNKAFNEFQKERLSNNDGKASDRTTMAFTKVVQSGVDECVGGVPVVAGYDINIGGIAFSYNYSLYSVKEQVVAPHDVMKYYLASEDGGFSYHQIPVSCEEVMVVIEQMKPAILYSRSKRCKKEDSDNPQLFGLMLPMLIVENEDGVWRRI